MFDRFSRFFPHLVPGGLTLLVVAAFVFDTGPATGDVPGVALALGGAAGGLLLALGRLVEARRRPARVRRK